MSGNPESPGNLVPMYQPNTQPVLGTNQYQPAAWGPPAPSYGEQPAEGAPWGRYLGAILRFKWLLLLIIGLGGLAGFELAKVVKPLYHALGKISIGSGAVPPEGAPIHSTALTTPSQWHTIFEDPAVVGRVVTTLGLYVEPGATADRPLFENFRLTLDTLVPTYYKPLVPVTYKINIDSTKGTYTLSAVSPDSTLETGKIGDPIGRNLGFDWTPQMGQFKGKSTTFEVLPVALAGQRLISNYSAVIIDDHASFLPLELKGDDPIRVAKILDTWINVFIEFAMERKTQALHINVVTTEVQRDSVQTQARQASEDLARFRQSTVTQPKDGPTVAGFALQEPSWQARYNKTKVDREDTKADSAALAQLLQRPVDSLSLVELQLIESVMDSPYLRPITADFGQLDVLAGQLAADSSRYVPTHPAVVEDRAKIATVRTRIAANATTILNLLIAKGKKLDVDLNSQAKDMAEIPKNSEILVSLQRRFEAAQTLADKLDQMVTLAKLTERSATPDVASFGPVVPFLDPISNTQPKLIAMAILASIGFGIVLAILLDRLDRRFRYPEQVSGELGLSVLGAVPKLKKGRQRPEDESQVVESYRSIRLGVRSSFNGTGQVAFTVSSANAGDGKSMISSNLAISFAEAGYRTLLVDGDARRGKLHETFNLTQRPGLLDHLVGTATLESTLRATEHANLTVMPCGTRRRQAPELLTGSAMGPLYAELKKRYDVIIIDSPPMGAGIDPFALGALTGNMLLVFRAGQTDLKMAKAKLDILRRLPVRELGAILNGVKSKGVYRYYQYIPGVYAATDDPHLAAETGQSLTANSRTERPDKPE